MRIITYTPILCFVLLAGCGMPEYEKRMDAQNKRIADYDEGNRSLDDPIDMKLVKKAGTPDEALWHVDFFLRLPKGYGRTPKDFTPYYDPFPCYRYTNPKEGEQSIFVAANLIPKGKDSLGEYSSVNFRSMIRFAIADYYLKTTKTKLSLTDRSKLPDRVVTAFGPYPATAPKLKYDFVSFSDAANKNVANPTQFDVYTHEANGKQVCIIVQHPVRMQNADAFNKSIEACLSSLDLSDQASTRRSQFVRTR